MAQQLVQQALGSSTPAATTTTPTTSSSSGSNNGGDYTQQLASLSGMGFNDRRLNTQLLREANGNLRVVFDQLRRRESFAASLEDNN